VIDRLYAAGQRWFDVASLPEIELIAERCLDAVLAFMHPIKSRHAIREAYFTHGVRIFSFDCEAELEKILAETNNATDLTLLVRVVVSNADASLPLDGKFGASAEDAPDLIRKTRAHADELGVCFHVGSQCMDPRAYRTAMRDVSHMIVKAGVTVDIVDVGGGFPSPYPGMTPPPLSAYMHEIEQAFEEMMVLENAELWCEPGRSLVAESVSVLARVELVKPGAVYLNDGAFGALYDLIYSKWPFPMRFHRAEGEVSEDNRRVRVFGPTCDPIDEVPGGMDLPVDIAEGDVIEFGMLGAYGETMSTQFNGFGRIETVEVSDDPFTTLFVERPAFTLISSTPPKEAAQ
jgi:ornithine decarboxylase